MWIVLIDHVFSDESRLYLRTQQWWKTVNHAVEHQTSSVRNQHERGNPHCLTVGICKWKRCIFSTYRTFHTISYRISISAATDHVLVNGQSVNRSNILLLFTSGVCTQRSCPQIHLVIQKNPGFLYRVLIVVWCLQRRIGYCSWYILYARLYCHTVGHKSDQ